MVISKELWGWISLIIAFVGYIPYLTSIFSGHTKPHMFSWFIWALLTTITWIIQYMEGAGAGAWVTLFTIPCTWGITWLAYYKGEKNITRSDWWAFITALLSIPLWIATKNPLWSILLIIFIEVLGFIPTATKSYHKPDEENAFTYFLCGFKFLLSLLAMETISWTTCLYPLAIFLFNGLLVLMLLWRRQQIHKTKRVPSAT